MPASHDLNFSSSYIHGVKKKLIETTLKINLILLY